MIHIASVRQLFFINLTTPILTMPFFRLVLHKVKQKV